VARRLAILGPGPQAFFFDAVDLLVSNPEFRTTTHLVGHCLREVESALRQVLRPEERRGGAGNEKHRKEIESILRTYELSDDKVLEEAWLSLAGEGKGFHAFAHRRNLAAPRPRDGRFEEAVERIEAVLDTVLRRFEERYVDLLPALDGLAGKEPTDEVIKELQNRIPQNLVTLDYLFQRITDPRWLDALNTAGYFQEPPGPDTDDEGRVGFVMWPASQLLLRLTESSPKEAKEIAQDIPATQNFRVYEDIAEIAAKLDAAEARELVPQLVAGLRLSYSGFLREPVQRVITKLAEEGFADDAFSLATELLAIEDRPAENPEGMPNA
jgi:hypothetical protein